MFTHRLAFAGVLFLACAVAIADDKPIVGKVDAVTVYRGQALVTRVVDVPGGAGLREVVVSELPPSVVPGSLYAESANGVEIRSVLYRERAVRHDIRVEVRKLDDQIRAVSNDITTNRRMVAVLAEQKKLLDEQAKFVGTTSNVELSRGVLNAETLQKITEFQFKMREDLATKELKHQREAVELQEKLSLLNRERSEITRGSAKTVREAVVFADFKQANAQLKINYLVNNATWSPSYIARASAFDKPVTLEYNASIQQQSGEDWGDVKMTLSTATPSLVARAPVLKPLQVALADPRRVKTTEQLSKLGYDQTKRELFQRRQREENRRNTYDNAGVAVGGSRDPMAQQGQRGQQLPGGGGKFNNNNPVANLGNFSAEVQQTLDANLNDLGQELQVLELIAKNPSRGKKIVMEESVSVTYRLGSRTSLPSRENMQLIQISSAELPANFHKLATPVLTSYVYNQAELRNDAKTVLLAGPVASYLEGEFVGAGAIPTVAVGESFTCGFGIDTSLRAGRELVDKLDDVQGGNRVMDVTYRLTIENFGSKAVKVRVMDRLPKGMKDQIEVTLVSAIPPISADPEYLARERKDDLLRWDIEVKPETAAAKATELKYQFRLEYDRQMSIKGLPVRR